MHLWFHPLLLIIFCVRIIKTSRFLFLLPLQSMNWPHHLFLYILWVIYQTVQDIVLLFHTIFILLAMSVLPPCQHLFICIISFIKMTHSCISLFVGFLESFLFHEIITLNKYKQFWYLAHVISWSRRMKVDLK